MPPSQKRVVEWRAQVGVDLGGESWENWGGIPGPSENGKSPSEEWVTSSWNGKTDGRKRRWGGTHYHNLSKSVIFKFCFEFLTFTSITNFVNG